MKKILSFFLISVFVIVLGIVVASVSHFSVSEAAGPTVVLPTGGTWVVDPEVTFTGKNAARSKELLNWTLQDYRWTFTKAGQSNPLETFWVIIRNIIYAVFILFVIATAFILIATRGKSLSAMRFIPRFFAIVLLVTFSFSLVSLLYQTTDLVQGFFLRNPRPNLQNLPCPPSCISQQDLFYIDWDYEKFVGYRLVGEQYAESAFINLLLVKLTAFTYFTMVGMLFVRKIILWFFIIVSPVFPLLLLYYPVRNTGKIWIGEFFRWLLYAPLFAIFLKGLVVLWRSGIPLNFDYGAVAKDAEITYPTATSILIGGPLQALALNNSANVVNTFALYVVALLMLWMVILLPWVLLQIFLEYAMNYNYADNPAYKGLMGWAKQARNPQKPPPAIPPPPPRKTTIEIPPVKKPIIPPPPPAGTGLARRIPTETTSVYKQPSLVIKPMPSYVKTLRMTNLSVPTLRDVARFETAMVANKTDQVHEISRVKETLMGLSNPASITNTTDQSRMTQIREQLVKESQSGNNMATTILNATKTINNVSNTMSQVTNNSSSQVVNQIKETISQISHPETISNVVEKQKYASMNQSLENASKQGDQFATATLNQMNTIAQAQTPEAQKAEIVKLKESLTEEKQKGNELAKQLVTFVDHQTTTVALPAQNQVQTVSLEDYEAVRKMWEKNYQTMEVPQSIDKGHVSRKDWIQDDVNEISKTINLLSSSDPELVDEGLQQVSTILPFLMMGGFTLPEITAYLKAKQQAATDSLEVVKGKEEEEESLVDSTEHVAAAAVKHQTMAIPTEGGSTGTSGGAGGPTSIDNDDEESALSNIKTQVTKTTHSVVNIFPSIMNAVKLTPNSTPSLRDVVKYESSVVSGKESITSEVTKTQELLTQLADPTIITNTEERERVQMLRSQLEKESQAGNPMATSIIQAATTIASVKNMTQQVTTQVRNSLNSITHPETVTDTTKQQTFKQINQELLAGKAKGDQFATNVLSHADVIMKTTPNTYNEQVAVAALKVKVDAEKQKGNQLASTLSSVFTTNITNVSQVAVRTALTNILHPGSLGDATKQQEYREVHQLLVTEKEKHNEFVTQILSLAEAVLAAPANSPQEQQAVAAVQAKITAGLENGDQTAKRVDAVLRPTGVSSSPAQMRGVIQLLLHPETISDVSKQQEYREIHDLVMTEKEKQNTLAVLVLSTAEKVVSAPQDSSEEREAISTLQSKVAEEKKKGNVLAQKLDPILNTSAAPVTIPTENRVQTVSLEDYEAVKKMWQDNYQNMDVPQNITEGEKSRKQWLEEDIAEITRIINLLSSPDPELQNEGITAVSHILPFLLIGGFSMSEIIAYLKAKLEAAKVALGIVQAAAREEEQKVEVNAPPTESTNQQAMAIEDTSDAQSPPPVSSTEIPLEEITEEKQSLKELGDEEGQELRYPEDAPKEPKDLEELDGKN